MKYVDHNPSFWEEAVLAHANALCRHLSAGDWEKSGENSVTKAKSVIEVTSWYSVRLTKNNWLANYVSSYKRVRVVTVAEFKSRVNNPVALV
jgi:hypothetical protein